MHVNIKAIFLFPALFIALFSCEDFLQQKIDVETIRDGQKLSITAVLDTDSGRFTIYIFEARSIASLDERYHYFDTIFRSGEIRLFENDRLLHSIQGPFDLSTRERGGYPANNDGYDTVRVGVDMVFPAGYNGYRSTIYGLPLKAGNTYKLEVEIEDYELASSTAIMPEAPIIERAELDTSLVVYKNNYLQFSNMAFVQSYPVYMLIDDNSYTDNNYYYIEQVTYAEYLYKKEAGRLARRFIALSDYALIRDNPDYLAQKSELSKDIYDMYWFEGIMLSDAAFNGAGYDFNLYVPAMESEGFPHHVSLEGLVTIDTMRTCLYRHDLVVKHITKETYTHYKNMALQQEGLDYFSEPVNVTGNIENAYGCFTLQNTRRIRLLNYVTALGNEIDFPD